MQRRNGSQKHDGLPADEEHGLQQARALMAQGRATEAKELYLKAIGGTSEKCKHAELELELGIQLGWSGQRDEASHYLEQAWADCPDRRSALAVQIQLELGTCRLWTGRGDEGGRLITLAGLLANSLGDPALKSSAALAHAALVANTGDAARAACEYEESAQLALRAGDRLLAAHGFHRASSHAFQIGRIQNALALSDKAFEQAESCGDLPIVVKVRSYRAMLRCMCGEWNLALDDYKAARSSMASLDVRPPEAFYLTSVDGVLRGWVRDGDSLDEGLTRLQRVRFPHQLFKPGGWIIQVKGKGLQGRKSEARAILECNAGNVPPQPPAGQFDAWAIPAFNVLSCWCDVEDAEQALAWYQRLEWYGELLVPHCFPALELGRAAALNEQWEDTSYWLSRALEVAKREAAQPFVAFTMYEFGLMHLRRNQGDDLLQARQYLGKAFELFDGLDMHRHRDEVGRRLGEMRKRCGKGEPSPREEQALRLKLMERRTRKEIAQMMGGISVKTVDRHLQDASRKLSAKGVHSDADRIAWLRRNGASSEDRQLFS
jgi:tetratricopeptide (TPR) repeat protein